MEIIFKNRPTPDLDINEIENFSSLEIIYREINLKPASIFLAKSSAIELANCIRDYLVSYKVIEVSNNIDRIEISGGGTDFEPLVRIEIDHQSIEIDHQSSVKNIFKRAFYLPEPEAEILAKALERWAKKPNL